MQVSRRLTEAHEADHCKSHLNPCLYFGIPTPRSIMSSHDGCETVCQCLNLSHNVCMSSGSDVTMAPQSEGSVQHPGDGGGVGKGSGWEGTSSRKGGVAKGKVVGGAKGSRTLPPLPFSNVKRVADSFEEDDCALDGPGANGGGFLLTDEGEDVQKRKQRHEEHDHGGNVPLAPTANNVYFDSSQQSGRRPQK